MATNYNGHVLPPAFASPGTPYYVSAGAGSEVPQPVLIAPITLQANPEEGALDVPAAIQVPGADSADPVFVGGVNIVAGGNAASEDGAAGVIIYAAAGGATVMEVGDTSAGNKILINGASGLGQVYDEVYNQPVSLQPISLSATNPLAAPDLANVGEIFRCTQAGVAASAAAAIGTNFVVPKSGWYSLQIEIALGNAPAPAAPDINVPIVSAGGIDIGQTLSFAIAKGVVVEPYGAMEYVAQEFAAADILVAGGNVIKQFVSQHLFDETQTYTFTLKSSSALWNIGTNGQIKAELIAMC